PSLSIASPLPPTLYSSFSLSRSVPHRDLHSFPTRRSSDLRGSKARALQHALGGEGQRHRGAAALFTVDGDLYIHLAAQFPAQIQPDPRGMGETPPVLPGEALVKDAGQVRRVDAGTVVADRKQRAVALRFAGNFQAQRALPVFDGVGQDLPQDENAAFAVRADRHVQPVRLHLAARLDDGLGTGFERRVYQRLQGGG